MSNRLALIIANSKFDDPKLSRLATPGRDAEAPGWEAEAPDRDASSNTDAGPRLGAGANA